MLSKNTILFAGGMLGVAALILVASLRGEPERKLVVPVGAEDNRLVQPEQLADWIISGRRDFVVVDMRSVLDHDDNHVRDSVHCGSCHESSEEGHASMEGEGFVDLSKKLVLYTETDAEPIMLPKALHDNPRLYRLAGGFEAWHRDILAPVSFEGLTTEEEVLAARKRAEVRAFFTGERGEGRSVAKLPVAPIRRRSFHKVASADEGC